MCVSKSGEAHTYGTWVGTEHCLWAAICLQRNEALGHDEEEPIRTYAIEEE